MARKIYLTVKQESHLRDQSADYLRPSSASSRSLATIYSRIFEYSEAQGFVLDEKLPAARHSDSSGSYNLVVLAAYFYEPVF